MSIALATPLAYSPSGIGASTNSLLRSNLHTFLSPLMSWATITNGYAYTLSSPQGLTAKLKVWDDSLAGDPDAVAFQMTSADGVRVGFLHHVRAASSRSFSAHACPCQLLLWVPGIGRSAPLGSAFQCGIPFVYNLSPASACIGPVGPGSADEAWWSCSDWQNAFSDTRSFRWSFEAGGSWDACYNAQLMLSSAPYQELARLRLVTQSLATPIPAFYGAPRTLLRGSNGPGGNGALYLDPGIMWGDTPTSPSTVKGQLWNAILDLTYIVDTVDFVNYMDDPVTDQSKWSALFLLQAVSPILLAGGRGNYVY